MKKINLIAPLLLVLALASCGKKEESKSKELSYRELSASINEYYKDVDTSLKGQSFIDGLTPIISNGYVKSSYSEAWNIIAEADEDPYDSNKVICQYTGKSIAKNLDSNSKGWNREHTYPKSHGFNHDSWAAYSDCHHLVATDSSINNIRGDLDFDEVKGGSSDDYGNKWTSTAFEPRDEVKGDVARRIFYMITRYNSDDLKLTITDSIPTSQSDKAGEIGKLSTLLKWHYQDPVSDAEIKRNDVVYSHQKNRNPYIDHPEWVNNAFESEYRNEAVDDQKVKDVINEIDKLPKTITLDDKEKVESIYTKMDSLNSQEKLYVTNYRVLTSAKTQIDYLSNSNNKSDANICIDFSSVTSQTTNGYEANHKSTIDSYSFTASSVFIGEGAYRLGTNEKKISKSSLSSFGIDGNGSYLISDFSTTGIKKIKVTIGTISSGTKATICVGSSDSWTKLETKSVVEGTTNCIIAECSPTNGQFAVVIENASKPTMTILKIEIYN